MSTRRADADAGSIGVAPGNDDVAERRMELRVGRLLQAGVLCSGAVVLIGGASMVARHGHDAADYRRFSGAAGSITSLAGVLHGVERLDGRAIVQLGLLLLIATPVARVALTAVAFAVRRDRLYALLSALVLALLAAGFLWGAA